jgi:hypothetical protein
MGLPKAGGHAGPPLRFVVFQWESDIRKYCRGEGQEQWHRPLAGDSCGFTDNGKIRAPSLALDWQIKRLIEVKARVSYHARRWYVHVASAFPLAHYYRAVLAWGP